MSTAALLLAPDPETALWRLAGEALAARSARILRSCGDLELLVVVGEAAVAAEIGESEADLAVRPESDQDAALDRLRSVGPDVVLVHEVARALAPPELVTAVVTAVRNGASPVVPAIAVSDTVKQITEDGTIVSTVDRETLRAVQTPYGFAGIALDNVIGAGIAPWQAAGPVTMVPGHPDAFAIDGPAGRKLAEQILRRRPVHS